MELDYGFTEEQQMIREIARKVAVEKVAPIALECDEKEELPWEAVKAIADADLSGVYIPEAYGGMGDESPVLNMCLVTEELSKACGGIALAFAASALGTLPILLGGSDELKKRFLPAIASGERLAAFGLTEPDSGSDVAAIRTKAVKDGDSYVIDGVKHFISNGGAAKTYTVFAVTDPTKGPRGVSAFVVEEGTPGFSFGKKEKKMGIRANPTCELIFQECRIPAANLIGREGRGFMMAMQTFDTSRPGVGAQALGIAAGALEYATKYARQRVVFGKPIWNHQGLAFKLADMAIKVEAARALIYAVARAIDAGFKRPTKYAAMAKTFASDIAMEVTTEAVQVLGGFGYMREYPVEKMMRDAKITQIYEGTNEIQRDEISRHLVKEAAN
jgi:alkylation response protein AidB-like acyl-CoA dehydrogenase